MASIPHSEIGRQWPSATLQVRTRAAALLCALIAMPSAAEELTLRKLRIESEPPGAEVLLIGGSAGYTPLTINERAIYPNDYRDDQAHLYGIVTLRHAGCDTYTHRVTLDDIERGLQVSLDCDAAPAAEPKRPPSITPSPTAGAPVASETVSQRRLRQLQVLQELLDEGLISAAEEQRIRRRLLEAP